MLSDVYQRHIEYLRLSVTDRCNLRCRYCMPLEGVVKKEQPNILSYEEMARLAAVFVGLGVKSIRITGGEPLVRKDLPRLVAKLKAIEGLEEVLLTTNGFQLKEMASELKQAGLSRINIHLDTLDPETYRRITRWGDIDDVLSGIQAAQDVGLDPIKLNCVLLNNYNEDEVEAMTYFAAERGLVLRFIELMPLGPGKEMQENFLPTQSVVESLSKHWTLVPYSQRFGRGPAEYYKVAELGSVIGLIHAVSQPFCDKCNRLRLSADGQVQDCLAYDESVSLRTLLRTPGVQDEKIAEAIKLMVGIKREDHGGFLLPQYQASCGMYGIGG